MKKGLLFFIFTVFFMAALGYAATPVIKVGHHVGFDRIVFNTSEKIPFSIERFPSYAVIRFEKAIDIDVKKLYETLAPSLRRISVEMEKNETVLIISNYPEERLLKYNTVKGAFYFDLYWPELELSCKTEKKSKDDALVGKKVGTEERRPSPEKQTLKENGEKTDISSSVQKTENPQTRIPSVQNETQAEYTFIDTQTPDGIPYTILRFLQSDNFYAFFYKDGYYWMVFPSKEQRKIPAYFSMDGAIQEIIQLPHKEAFIVRLTVNPAYSFVESAPNGDVYFAQEDFFVEKGRDMSPFILSSEKGVELEIDEHTAPIRFLDPIVGNEIIALPSSKDFLKDKYSYDFMETLPSERGIVFISKTEYFEAVPSENGFMFIP